MKTVTIFIPAFNEEKNIQNVLEQVLQQKFERYTLEKILVISDASSDATDSIVTTMQSTHPIITLKNDGKRIGVAGRSTQALNDCTTDVLVRIDADVKIDNEKTIENLLNYFTPETGLVCGNVQVAQPQNITQRIAYFGKRLWNNVRDELDDKALSYRCHGALWAISKEHAHTVAIPNDIGADDDTFLFFDAIKKGRKVQFAPDAIVYQQLPNTIKDYVSQHVRYDVNTIKNHFDQDFISKYKTITFSDTISQLFKLVIKQPYIGFLYIIIRAYIYIKSRLYRPTTTWDQPTSTKSHT